MNLSAHNNNIEHWFLDRKPVEFPESKDYVSTYTSIAQALKKIHKQVTAGADLTDNTSLTWHDESHINKVISQASRILQYKDVELSPFEVFTLLVAIQIHDVKNIEGRTEHENRAIQILSDLNIEGLVDSILLKNIGFIASCHAGSYNVGTRKEKDKISLLAPTTLTGFKQIRLRFLAAVLRLADEYSDDSERAMSYLLEIGKIKAGSIIHQMHAKSLLDVNIEPDTGKVDFDYHINVSEALKKYPKYIKDKDTFEDVYLLDEIFERSVKSHYETIYCMRFLRPSVSINKLKISIEIDSSNIHNQLIISYELEEKGYPNSELTILDLCGEKLKQNGGYWSGENLKNYLEEHNFLNP